MRDDSWLMGALAAQDAYRGDDPQWPPASRNDDSLLPLPRNPARDIPDAFFPHLSDPATYGSQPAPSMAPNATGKVPSSDTRLTGALADAGNALNYAIPFGGPAAGAAKAAVPLIMGGIGRRLPAAAETITGATVRVGDRVFHGPNHVAAMDNAVRDLGLGGTDELIDRLGFGQHRQAEGFLTSSGRVIDRAEAARIAEAAGQGAASRPKSLKMEDIAGERYGMGSLANASSYRPIAPGDTRVSTRFPTGVTATEDPLKQHLSIGLDEMRTSPGYEKNISLLDQYPGFAHLQGMGTDEAARAYIRQAAGNLDYLYRRSPEVMKQRSPVWYEGAHEISDVLAQRWGVPRQSSSAALASLSPQMDWFKNASLGERTGDIITSAAAGRPMTSEMEAVARSPRLANLFGGERTGDLNKEMLRRITGKTFDRIDDPLEQALWLRLRDEAHNPRAYRTITPEGNFGDFVLNKDGSLANVGWGGLGEIRKAITALKSGGDMNIISPALGNMHKVRSFYNNIENPHYPLFGDVTADMHQVAGAQLRPLSGSSPAVEHNLSGGAGASSSALSGVRGTYGLTADATRMMAAEHGLLPRAGQSATWEPVRELFTKEWKTPENANKVDSIWRAHDRGDISIEQARDAIFDLAGGIGTPSWARPGIKVFAPTQGSTYR